MFEKSKLQTQELGSNVYVILDVTIKCQNFRDADSYSLLSLIYSFYKNCTEYI